MEFHTVENYVVVIAGLVAIVKGIVDIIKAVEPYIKSNNTSISQSVKSTPVSFGNKINALILSIGIVVMLGGIGWLSYNNTLVDVARQEYFKGKDPLLQYNLVFSQKFEEYFNSKYIQPPFSMIGISFILLSLTIFLGSFSKTTSSKFQTTFLFTLEIIWFLLGVWLVISNQ